MSHRRFEFRAEIEHVKQYHRVHVPRGISDQIGSDSFRQAFVWVNGHRAQVTLHRVRGNYLMALDKTIRAAAGVEAGDVIDVRVEVMPAPPTLDLPAEMENAFRSAPAARRQFEELSFPFRREHVRWILAAKRTETRERRVNRLVEHLFESDANLTRP